MLKMEEQWWSSYWFAWENLEDGDQNLENKRRGRWMVLGETEQEQMKYMWEQTSLLQNPISIKQ